MKELNTKRSSDSKKSFTVGIPTYYGGPGLVKSVKSVLKSRKVGKFPIVVAVDGNPLEQNIRKELKELGVRVIENKDRGGQVARINQLISLCKTELIILTQDDILFEADTIYELVKGFEQNPKVTMESGKVVPLKATNFFEKVVQVGVSISYTIGRNWGDSDNYFLAGGRCLAFRTKAAKKIKMPEEVLNSDTYLYFANQKIGGKFLHIPNAIYHMRSPKTLRDHLRQSKKYQFVPDEMKHYLKVDINKVQPIPAWIQIKAFLKELFINPVLASAYFIVMFYTRVSAKDMYKNAKRFWDTDVSTKEI